MDATPLVIVPLKRNAPASVATVTLWGTAASPFVNAIPNGTSAGPVIELGEKRKSRASMVSTTGATVGRGVGFGVGLSVGLGVGLAVGVGAGVAVGLGVAPDAAGGGVVATGDAVALGASVGEGAPVGAADGAVLAAGDDDASPVADTTGEPIAEVLGTAAPHAATNMEAAIRSSPAAPARGVGGTGIAAL